MGVYGAKSKMCLRTYWELLVFAARHRVDRRPRTRPSLTSIPVSRTHDAVASDTISKFSAAARGTHALKTRYDNVSLKKLGRRAGLRVRGSVCGFKLTDYRSDVPMHLSKLGFDRNSGNSSELDPTQVSAYSLDFKRTHVTQIVRISRVRATLKC